jgi:hypothetical protein
LRAHAATREFGIHRVESELVRDEASEFHAGGIHAGGRVVGAKLSTRAGRDRGVGVAEQHDDAIEIRR